MTPIPGEHDSAAVGMSPQAIERRLRDLADLYNLGVIIEESRRAGKFRALSGGTPPVAPGTQIDDGNIR